MKPLRLLLAMLLMASLSHAENPGETPAGGVREDAPADNVIPVGNGDPLPSAITNPQTTVLSPRVASPSATTTTPASSADSGGVGGMLSGLLGACSSFFGALFGKSNNENAEDLDDISDEVDRMNEQAGNVYERDYDEADQRALGSDVGSHLLKGCHQFVDSEGRIGPWGRDALTLIKENPASYAEKSPADLVQWCPGYKTMSKQKREIFWLWVFASISSSEAGCNPKALNPYNPRNPNSPPNGDAIGLFQLEPRVCDGKSKQQLFNAHVNTRCAVKVLAAEMQRRGTLLDYEKDTYWGPLRGNTRHRGDASGGARMKAQIPKFKGCK